MEQLRRLPPAVDDFQQRAALLAYHGFFSLFPLLLVAVTMLSPVLQGRSDLGGRVVASTLVNMVLFLVGFPGADGPRRVVAAAAARGGAGRPGLGPAPVAGRLVRGPP
ncbi:MAG: hypothetical protein ACJ75K_15805, partial [Actinomycetes bacterium]